MKKEKMKRSLLMMAIIIGVVANLFVFTPKSVSAASYPLTLVTSTYASVGDLVPITVMYSPVYKNERLTVNVYSEKGTLLATASHEFYNTSIKIKYYIVKWDTSGLSSGTYKVEIKSEFYTYYTWYESPHSTVGYITLKDDLDKGVINSYEGTEDKFSCISDTVQEVAENTICSSYSAWAKNIVKNENNNYCIQLKEMYIGDSSNSIIENDGYSNPTQDELSQWIIMKYEIKNNGSQVITASDILFSGYMYKYTGNKMTIPETATLEGDYDEHDIYSVKIQPNQSDYVWIGIYVPRSQGMPYLNVGTEENPIFLNTNPNYVADRHGLKHISFKFPSCTETGHIEYYKCSLCGELFKDEKGTQPITQSETVIEKDEHSYVNRLEKASIYENGKMYTECEYCFKKKGAITYIYRPKTVVLEKQYYYSGKKIQPKIVIKDIKGKVISPNEYRVTYTNNINPGTGKVTIIFKGNHYEGKITRSFKIVLRNTSALSVKNISGRKIAVSWKKTALVSGYQIKYSVGNKAKTLTVSNKYTSKKISNLSKGKTYKVYIRTYKVVKGKKVYSAWSKARSVKIVR